MNAHRYFLATAAISSVIATILMFLGMDQHIAVIELDAPLLHPLDDLQRKTHSYSAADMNTIRTHTYTAWGLKTRLGRERRACRQISG